MGTEIIIGMGEFRVSHNDDTLTSLGLGSCVGIAIIDDKAGIGGLAHIMLPSTKEIPSLNQQTNLAKFADYAISEMLKEMEKNGAKKENMKAKIAGGAHMFTAIENNDKLNIGKRNSDAVVKLLEENKIPIISKEIGGSIGRTVKLDLGERKFIIKTKEGIKEI